MLTLLSLIACTKDAPVDTGSVPTIPDIPVDACASHEWLATDDLGERVLSYREDALSLSAQTVNTLLESNGLTVIEAQYDVSTYALRYTTQDRGEKVEATAFVTFPDGVEPGAELPVILWLHPTMGFMDDCAPTAVGLEGAAFPVLWASQGYIVVAPDYLGMRGFGEGSEELHPYIIAEPTAVASLDALRSLDALVAQHEVNVVPDKGRLIHWGPSEGGFAALWTDRYQEAYLPEYETVAVISAIPPTDLEALTARGVSKFGATTGGVAAALTSMQQYYDGPPLDQVLQPNVAAALPGEMADSCSDFPVAESMESIEQIYTPEGIAAATSGDWTGLEAWQCYLNQGTIREAPFERGSTAPVFVVLAEDDDLAWAPPARDDVVALCEQGYVIEYMECAGAGHVDGAAKSLPQQLDFLDRMVNGGEPLDPCVIHEPVECELEGLD